METIYTSKIDTWLAVTLLFSMVICVFASYQLVKTGQLAAILAAVPILAIGVGLPFWLVMTTTYSLNKDRLFIKTGPFKWVVPLEAITKITPSSSLLASPALSVDRLRIVYGNGSSVMISPRNKEQFISEIESLRGDSGKRSAAHFQ